MNPGHPRGQQAVGSMPAGPRAVARPPGAFPSMPSRTPEIGRREPPSVVAGAGVEKQGRKQKRAEKSEDASRAWAAEAAVPEKMSPVRTAAVILGILVVAGLVLFGSAKASAWFHRSPGGSAGPRDGGALAMPRPDGCAGSSIWGMRRIATGQSYWSCTTRDGINVRFYDVPKADLAQQTNLRCPTDGVEGNHKYVDCVKIDTKK